MTEFEFLKGLRTRYSLSRTGDDCAVLPFREEADLLLTADMLVENVDFRLEWTTPEFLGHKALAVSLSDIAAMGGTPKWSMLSIGVPDKLWKSDFLDRFYEGWFGLARQYDVELVGGDISQVPSGLVVDSTVGGEVEKGKAFLRSGAKPGDKIFVSGFLGAAAGGLKLLETGTRFSADLSENTLHLLEAQLEPSPELQLANLLEELDIVTSAIDLSDGLSSDLNHICNESGVGAIVKTNLIPMAHGLMNHFPPNECLKMALDGGEDFRLLFTVRSNRVGMMDGLDVTQIGEITSESGRMVLVRDGRRFPLHPHGFKHF
jgi:thiamine-monophosphate kinase